jgi:hypothetical protein
MPKANRREQPAERRRDPKLTPEVLRDDPGIADLFAARDAEYAAGEQREKERIAHEAHQNRVWREMQEAADKNRRAAAEHEARHSKER